MVVGNAAFRRQHRKRRPANLGRMSSKAKDNQEETDAFSDVFAEQVFRGGTPLLVKDGQVQLDVGKEAKSQGLSVKWGLLKEAAPAPDDSEAGRRKREQLRNEAAAALVNIDSDERDRRDLIGNVLALVVVLVAVAQLASSVPWTTRAAMFPLLALAYGFKLSAKEGL